ncbi:actinin alpha 2 [Entomortierella beljakovae]|nr:actinin alpha 2 [Entomortierella beljakovae]
MVRQFAASQLDTQKTAFMRWVNDRLANTPNYVPMTSIDHDLRDGKRLIALLEIVSKEHLKPERGSLRIHHMANVSKTLAFLEKRVDEPLGSIGNEDIVDGNLKLTLGLVWIIIYRFQIQQIANTMAESYPALATEDMIEGEDNNTKGKKKGSSQQVDAKQALLRWVRYQLEDYSDVIPPIQDFHRSWRTGLAFAALIHRHDPEYLPEFYSEILPLPFETPDEWRGTLTKSFEIAFEKLSLPRLLDPEDLVDVETPDERSIMTYISEYFIIMSKHQLEQDPAIAAQMRALRLQAKDERMALAGEDQEARRLRLQEEQERRRREEEEELERIRLKRMEIEGWSIRAAERAREEEEALRKRREEEEERRLQRKLRREQREREKALLLQQGSGGHPHRHSRRDASGAESVFSESDNDLSDSDIETVDPKDLERRQADLDEKLAEYHQGIAELSEWVLGQDSALLPIPDTTSLLDRARDLDPLTEAFKAVEEELTIKEHIMSHLHDVREELLEYENPDLAPEKVNEVDKRWWELETIWTALSNKVVDAKDAAEEVKWIIDCSQEIDRLTGETSKFEAQLQAFAEKRSQETPQDRSEKAVLEEQDFSLSSISFLIKTYVDFLTSLMDPKVHHYTAPAHLTAMNNELTTERLPSLSVVIEKAQQNLANDRLLRTFLDTFSSSDEWIGESVEWLANIEVPIFITEDRWNGGSTVKEYLARDVRFDLDLYHYQNEIDELKGELEDEQKEVNNFRSTRFAILDEQATAATKAVVDTQDVTEEVTVKTVQDLMGGIMKNLEMVEKLLPKEAKHCDYAGRILDYLWDVQALLEDLEQAYVAIHNWEMRQPDAEVEAYVIRVEEQHTTIDSSLKDDRNDSTVIEVVPTRHAGLGSVTRNLRVCFQEKQEAIKGDRQMKEFLEFTLTCQATLRDLRAKLQDGPPMTGFGLNEPKPFDDFAARVRLTGESFDKFEQETYASYLTTGEQVRIMAATSGARQDPTIVQNKLQSVGTLLTDIKALKADRERDSDTVAECRKLYSSLFTLDSDLQKLESDFVALEHLEPGQDNELAELGNRSNQLLSQFAILEQDSVYRHIAQDPSCSTLLRDIAQRQASIQQTQERLQSKLEVKQQWDMAWEAFTERSQALQDYLWEVENDVLGRGYVSLDCLSPDESEWGRTEDDIRDAQAANEETLSSLKVFKTSRIPELTALAKSLKKISELTGGAQHMDDVRAGQFRDSDNLQKDLKAHLARLHEMNSQEKHQLDTLKQRLLWSQHVSESKADVNLLLNSCQDAVKDYTEILKGCEKTGDTSGLDHVAASHLKEQIQHLISMAVKEKQARFDNALQVYSLLEKLALNTEYENQSTDSTKSIPEHLVAELSAFKNQYDSLDLQLQHANQLADHASQVASYLDNNNAVDNKLNAIATELKADMEASTKTIEKASAIRAEFEELSKELPIILSASPRPSDTVESTLSVALDEYKSNLENALKSRLDHSVELNKALDPLLKDYHDLLHYQDGLRTHAKDLEAHSQWLEPSNEKIKLASEKIQAIFNSWPEQESSQKSSQVPKGSNPSSSENVSNELAELRSKLTSESAHIESKEQEFQSLKQDIQQSLESATSHSKELHVELENSLESIEDRIQSLKTDVRHKTYQLECLEKQSAWEKELKKADDWCQEFDSTLTNFADQQAQWKADSVESRALNRNGIADEMQKLDSSIAEFEAQLESYENQIKPVVQNTWTEFCGSLVMADKDIPIEFQDRQTALADKSQLLRAKIAYGAEVVKQRKALEAMNGRINELERLKADLLALGTSSVASNNGDSKNPLSLDELESKIVSLAKELEKDFDSIHYPVNNSTSESRLRSEESNAQVREHIQSCRAQVEATKQSLEEALHNREVFRRRQELEAIQRDQDSTILDKTNNLEKVSNLLNWANETTNEISTVLASESNDTEKKSLEVVLPSVLELAELSYEALSSLSSKLDAIRSDIDSMVEYKKEVQDQVVGGSLDGQVDGLQVTDANDSKFTTGLEPALRDIEGIIEQNRGKISQLDQDIQSKLSEFDSKTVSMLRSLEQHSETVSSAINERQRQDEETARLQELERLRIQRAKDIEQFEEFKSKFLTWSENQVQDLNHIWDSNGYITKIEDAQHDNRSITVESAVTSLESSTLQFNTDLFDKEPSYKELKEKIDLLYGGVEHESERKRHLKVVESAWRAVNDESAGFTEILNQMKQWSDLRNDLNRFEKEGLGTLERRVEGLRWMHWDAFQPEEEQLLKFIEDIEGQVDKLRERAEVVNSIEQSSNIQEKHRAILGANRAYFDERLDSIPDLIDASKNGIRVIRGAAQEIAFHAKFRADLVRVEAAISQQIEAVKARLGSLERTSCFALNSKALEAVVQAADEVCNDAKYQFSVLQEVEYSGLEQTAFELDALAAEDGADLDGGSSTQADVQESMQRIRQALRQLESYIEEDCFETLLAAKFYTHCKATEDIRRWTTTCRDDMLQLDSADKNQDLGDKAKRQQNKEWKSKHLESIEKRLGDFDGTIKHYDNISNDFMMLHHPQSSSLDLSEQPESPHTDSTQPAPMRVILRRTVIERTKRTREDWELLKQEFLTKASNLSDQSLDDGDDSMDADQIRRGLTDGSPVIRTKFLSGVAVGILDDISRVTKEVQELFDHVSSGHSTLSLVVESNGAVTNPKDRLDFLETYIHGALQDKVKKFEDMLLTANEQSEQEQARLEGSSELDVSTRSHKRRQEKMVGVAMQRGQIAEQMKRLVEYCDLQHKELEDSARVQNAMHLIQKVNMLFNSMKKALGKADKLLVPVEAPASTSLYSIPSASASSTTSLASMNLKSPRASPSVSPAANISRATALSRERRASRASASHSFSLSSLSEDELHEWESNYRSLMEELDGYTHDIEQLLDDISSMADSLNDWRLDESYGVTTEKWKKLKALALAKKQELDRFWARRSGGNENGGVHPHDTLSPTIRPSLLQPTASSSNRVKAVLGAPLDPSPPQVQRKKRASTGTMMSRGAFVTPSPTPTSSIAAVLVSPSSKATRLTSGRVRSGTAPGLPLSSANNSQTDLSRRLTSVASPILHAMSPTFSQDAKRRPPVIRKNDSTSSVSSLLNACETSRSPSRQQQQQRTIYKPDMSNALDVEVAKVVNASGFSMKVQRLKEGQSPYLGPSNGKSSRSRSDSTSSLVLSGLSDNGGYEGGLDSQGSSPRAVKTIRGQSRLNVQGRSSDNQNGEVGRYVFGDVEPKICYCRILRSRKVMVRVGGGWAELSKFMEDHASLEQRKVRSRLLSASNSSVSVASHFGGSTTVLSGTESRHNNILDELDGSSDSLSDGPLSGSGGELGTSNTNLTVDGKSRRKKKEVIYHIRPSDGMSLQSMKFVKNGAGEGLVAI